MNKKFWSAILPQALGLLLASSAISQAATYVVDPAGSGQSTTIQGAIDQAGAGDIVEVKSGTYNENVTIWSRDITLQTAEGADVTINGVNGMPLTVIYNTNVTVKGTAGHPLVVTRTEPEQLVEAGATNGTITMEYVNFNGTCNTAGFSAGSDQSDPAPTITLNHCNFNLTCGVSIFMTWRVVNLTFNDCAFDMTGNGQIIRHNSTGLFQANRCTFVAHGTGGAGETTSGAFQFGDPFGINDFMDKTQTMECTDCTFQNFSWAYEQWAGQMTMAQGAKKTIKFINPTLKDNQIGLAKLNGGENLIVRGKSATDKCDFTDDTPLVHFVDVVKGGNVLIEDVILKGAAWTNQAVNIAGNMDDNATVTLSRCLISAENNAFVGNLDNHDGNGGATVTFDLVNCIVKMGNDLIKLTGNNKTNLTLTHCTTLEGTGATGATGINLGGSDTLAANYSIFNAADASNVFANAALTGKLNIINHASGNGFSAVPADTILADAKIDGTGHLTNQSQPADRKATASTVSVDYDGESRPLMGTVPDIGADEGYTVPVTLSTFTVE